MMAELKAQRTKILHASSTETVMLRRESVESPGSGRNYKW